MNICIFILTSIKSLFAPSEIAARLSYCSGSKSFRAEVRYSPAGVVLTISVPDLTNATALSVLSDAKGTETTSPGRPLVLVLSFLSRKIQIEEGGQTDGSIKNCKWREHGPKKKIKFMEITWTKNNRM